jgi:hypothetical protein
LKSLPDFELDLAKKRVTEVCERTANDSREQFSRRGELVVNVNKSPEKKAKKMMIQRQLKRVKKLSKVLIDAELLEIKLTRQCD